MELKMRTLRAQHWRRLEPVAAQQVIHEVVEYPQIPTVRLELVMLTHRERDHRSGEPHYHQSHDQRRSVPSEPDSCCAFGVPAAGHVSWCRQQVPELCGYFELERCVEAGPKTALDG